MPCNRPVVYDSPNFRAFYPTDNAPIDLTSRFVDFGHISEPIRADGRFSPIKNEET